MSIHQNKCDKRDIDTVLVLKYLIYIHNTLSQSTKICDIDLTRVT